MALVRPHHDEVGAVLVGAVVQAAGRRSGEDELHALVRSQAAADTLEVLVDGLGLRCDP